jgi:hypothetical protein
MSVLPTRPLAPAAPQPSGALPRWADLKRIADAQRQVLVAFLVGLLVIPLSIPLSAALGGGWTGAGGHLSGVELGTLVLAALVLAVRVWMAVGTYRLASAMGPRAVAIVWTLGTFLPSVLGLVVLVLLISRATKRLKKFGLRVGLLGAKLPEQPPPGFLCEEVTGAFS